MHAGVTSLYIIICRLILPAALTLQRLNHSPTHLRLFHLTFCIIVLSTSSALIQRSEDQIKIRMTRSQTAKHEACTRSDNRQIGIKHERSDKDWPADKQTDMKQANDRIDKIAKHEAFTRSDRQPNLKNVQDQDLQAGPFRLFTLGLHLLDQSENVNGLDPQGELCTHYTPSPSPEWCNNAA